MSAHNWHFKDLDRLWDEYMCSECGYLLDVRGNQTFAEAEEESKVPTCDEYKVMCVHLE